MNIQAKATLQLPVISLIPAAFIFALLCAAAAAAYTMTPRLVSVENAPNLEDEVPRQFGDWKEVKSPFVQIPLTTGLDPYMAQPYDQVVMRTYINSAGFRVMLALAWGKKQRQEIKIHRPELCYIAQGFDIQKSQTTKFENIQGGNNFPISGRHMQAQNKNEREIVSYWMRVGDEFTENAIETRLHIFKSGLKGKIPDGILVRASTRVQQDESFKNATELLDNFLVELVNATPKHTQTLLIGQES